MATEHWPSVLEEAYAAGLKLDSVASNLHARAEHLKAQCPQSVSTV